MSAELFERGQKVDVESSDVAWYVNSSNFSSEFLGNFNPLLRFKPFYRFNHDFQLNQAINFVPFLPFPARQPTSTRFYRYS